MALRPIIAQNLEPETILTKVRDEPGVDWTRYRCKLVTPMYGGGVEAGKVDTTIPFRTASIRGQLRYWWRFLAINKWWPDVHLDAVRLRDLEFALWGGIGNEARASRVWVVVEDLERCDASRVEPCAKYEASERNGKPRLDLQWSAWAECANGYALFPAQGEKKQQKETKPPARLLREGAEFSLAVGLATRPPAIDGPNGITAAAQIREALRWWATFGGVGARTRRGLGAIEARGLDPINAEEAAAAGCVLKLSTLPPDTAAKAWDQAVGRLREFRQGNTFGRRYNGSKPGRSKWPEADAIRMQTGMAFKGLDAKGNVKTHAPSPTAIEYFPRAAFGLPIIFHFKDSFGGKGIPPSNDYDPNFTLMAEMGDGKSRLASPLILRPYPHMGKWVAAALLLPHAHLEHMTVRLPNGRPATGNRNATGWWNPSLAAHVEAMQKFGKTDALSAFMAYF